jgi:NAD(P)-dependent dehydrogenase (short-subunit alcohol dehydrogenase family)
LAPPQLIRNVLVLATGDATMGIAVSKDLASRGHELNVVMSRDATPVHGERIRCFTLDDASQDLEVAVKSLFESASPLDAVVLANSAIGEVSPIEHLKSDHWSQALQRNSTLSFLICREAVPVLRRAQDARIVFIVPEQTRALPQEGRAAYLCAKATVIGLARTLALELGPEGILVNSIACALDESAACGRVTRTTRKPEPRDVAAAVTFLLSPATSFITGTTLDVNGGRSML